MKAEHIHEALNLLPDDLIEAADWLRSTKAPIVSRRWQRWGALAACLAVLILGVFAWQALPGISADSMANGMAAQGDMESIAENSTGRNDMYAMDSSTTDDNAHAQESAVESEEYFRNEPSAYAVTSLSVSSGTAQPFWDHPQVVVFRSRQELEDYFEACGGGDDLAALREACESYDDTYFAENDLILADLGQGSSSVRHEIHTLAPLDDATWELQGYRITPEETTDDMVQWYSVVEVAFKVFEPGDEISLNLTDVEE